MSSSLHGTVFMHCQTEGIKELYNSVVVLVQLKIEARWNYHNTHA